MLSRGTDDDSIQQTMSNSAQEKANENLKLVTDFNVGVCFLSLLFYNFYMVTGTYFFFFLSGCFVAVTLPMAYLPWYLLKASTFEHSISCDILLLVSHININPTNNWNFERYSSILQWKQFLALIDYFCTA